jgi:hypothetical protein
MMLMKGKSAISNCSSSCNLLDLLLSCACGQSLQSSYYLKIKRWRSKFDNISLMKKIILNLLKKKKKTKPVPPKHISSSSSNLTASWVTRVGVAETVGRIRFILVHGGAYENSEALHTNICAASC